jgi:hypothetical protein
VPARGRAAGARQQPQAVVQVRREAVDPESLDARCRELDRQRNPVELSANFGYDWGVRVPQLELVQAPRYTLDKQLNGRET